MAELRSGGASVGFAACGRLACGAQLLVIDTRWVRAQLPLLAALDADEHDARGGHHRACGGDGLGGALSLWLAGGNATWSRHERERACHLLDVGLRDREWRRRVESAHKQATQLLVTPALHAHVRLLPKHRINADADDFRVGDFVVRALPGTDPAPLLPWA